MHCCYLVSCLRIAILSTVLEGPMIAKRIGDAAAVWVLAIGYAMATAVSLHASESLELGEEVFSNNCGNSVVL